MTDSSTFRQKYLFFLKNNIFHSGWASTIWTPSNWRSTSSRTRVLAAPWSGLWTWTTSREPSASRTRPTPSSGPSTGASVFWHLQSPAIRFSRLWLTTRLRGLTASSKLLFWWLSPFLVIEYFIDWSRLYPLNFLEYLLLIILFFVVLDWDDTFLGFVE